MNETESELAAERRQRSVLRQRVLAAAREGQSVERIVETDWEEEVKLCSAELFHSLAVAAKLQQMSISGKKERKKEEEEEEVEEERKKEKKRKEKKRKEKEKP